MQKRLVIIIIIFWYMPLAMAQNPFLVKDVASGTQSSATSTYVVSDYELCFQATNQITNFQLWKTRGDSAFLLKGINPGGTSIFSHLTSIGSAVYFSGSDGVHDYELWKARDDTAYMVKDYNPAGKSAPQNFFEWNGELYFTASNGVHGIELCRLDMDSIILIHDINKGSQGTKIDNFTKTDSVLYFTAAFLAITNELWMTDGVKAKKVKGIPYKRFVEPENFVTLGQTVYFSAESPTHGRELWKTIGDSAYMVKDINAGINSSNPSHLTVIDSILYFTADNGSMGIELYQLKGDSIVLMKDINAGASNASPYDLNVIGKSIYFLADEGVNVRKLWRTNGDTCYKLVAPSTLNAATIAQRLVVGNKMYFSASFASGGQELWVVQNDSIKLLKDINPGSAGSNPKDFEAVGDIVYFNAEEVTTGIELWMVLNNSVMLVKDIAVGAASSTPSSLVATNNSVYFHASDITHGQELWKVKVPIYTEMKQTACNGYTFGSKYLTQTGKYFDTLVSSNNRDSIVILYLVINTINTNVTASSLVLTSLANNATYQWLNCNKAYLPIAGETQATYTADSNGSYAVEIKQNGCTDTSNCIIVQQGSVSSNWDLTQFAIYPNPTNNSIFIANIGNLYEPCTIELYDIHASFIKSHTHLGLVTEIPVSELATGIYLIKICTATKSKFFSIVIE